MASFPLPHHPAETDKNWLHRCLEETMANLQDLHLLRQETEKRVREALKVEQDSEEAKWALPIGAKSEDEAWARSERGKSEQGLLQNLVSPGRVFPIPVPKTDRTGHDRTKLGHRQEKTDQPNQLRSLLGQSKEHLDWVMSGKLGAEQDYKKILLTCGRVGPRENCETRRTKPGQDCEEVAQVKPRRTKRRESQEDGDWYRPGMPELEEHQDTMGRRLAERSEFEQNPEDVERSRYWRPELAEPNRISRELPLSGQFPDNPALCRIGSGTWVPRLKLGSSGVTSDLLFTIRMSGNSLSAPSSGFYEASDLDSASSCSSLCSEASSSTSFSVMSPRRNSSLRPKSSDCSAERKKELHGGRTGARRPMSAGALDSSFLLSFYNSRQDVVPEKEYLADLHDALPAPPPLSVIHQRRRAERYICKLALRYRCRPGVSSLLPDLGPPLRRSIANLPSLPQSPITAPPSPHCSLSSSVSDVRRIHKGHGGSWGRFLSRVVQRRDPRTAASELNLEQCGRVPRDTLQGRLPDEGQLVRAKSFKDLLSVNPFKRSQKSLNKAWTLHA